MFNKIMMMEEEVKTLSRFTTLPILLDLLQRKKLTLLNPKTWEDQNDAAVLLEYSKIKGINNIFAVCFSWEDETIHHWKSFSGGSGGCVIKFYADKLLECINKVPHTTHKKVIYKKLREANEWMPGTMVDDIPFIKRYAYRCEYEYRIIATPPAQSDFFEIDISLEAIKEIKISQQMPEQIFKTIKTYLAGLSEDPESRIRRSTLFENKRWINTLKDVNVKT